MMSSSSKAYSSTNRSKNYKGFIKKFSSSSTLAIKNITHPNRNRNIKINSYMTKHTNKNTQRNKKNSNTTTR